MRRLGFLGEFCLIVASLAGTAAAVNIVTVQQQNTIVVAPTDSQPEKRQPLKLAKQILADQPEAAKRKGETDSVDERGAA
jgi:hypothetical protein